MMIMILIIPVTMIGFGRYFTKNPPKEINDIFGYRSSMSMKNNETWAFAHHYCGKLWVINGWIMLSSSIVTMMCIYGEDKSTIGISGGILCGVQLIIMLGTIVPTERALKKNFDRAGNKR